MAGWRGDDKGKKPAAPRKDPAPAPRVESAKGGWRGNSSEALPPSRKGWQKERQDGGSRTGWQKPALFTALGLFLILAFVFVLLRITTATPVVVLAVDDYTPLEWPANLYATEDRQRWEAIKGGNLSVASLGRGVIDKSIDDRLSRLSPGGPDKSALVVYLSAHGVVDEDEATQQATGYLLSSAAKPYQKHPNDWTPLRDLLGRLEKQAEAKKATIVLLLESGRVTPNWSHGVLRQTFTEELQEACRTLKRLVVIHSCSPGQENWRAPELGGSVFGYFAARGLAGEADTNDLDESVSLQELQDYLIRKVDGWVQANRGRSQRPLVLGPENVKIQLAWKSQLPEAPAPPVETWAARLDRLATAWQSHDELARRQPWRQRPILWGRYEHQLLSMQDLILAGESSSAAFDDAFRRAQATSDQLESQAESNELPSLAIRNRILPPTQVIEVKPDPAPPRAAQPKEKPNANDPTADAGKNGTEDKDAENTDAPGKDVPPAAAPKALATPFERLEGIRQLLRISTGKALPATPVDLFKTASSGRIFSESRDGLEAWLTLVAAEGIDRQALQAARDRWTADTTVEYRFVSLLDEWVDWDSPQAGEAAEVAALALRARHLSELASAADDVRARFGVASLVNQGDEVRRLAEDRLLTGGPGRLQEARQSLSSLLTRDSPYWQAIERGELLSRAWRLRDEVFAGMPWIAQWWCRSESRTEIAESRFLELRNALVALNRRLVARVDLDDGERRSALDQEIAALRSAWVGISGDFGRHFDTDLADREAFDDGRVVGEAFLALQVPQSEADSRRQVVRKLIDRMKSPAAPTASLKKTASDEATITRNDFGRWSIHPAVWAAQYDSTDVTLEKDDRGDKLVSDGVRIRRKLRTLTDDIVGMVLEVDRLFQQSDSELNKARENAIEQDSRARALAPLVLGGELGAEEEPALKLRQMDLAEWYRWLARRAITDYWAGNERNSPDFFEQTARRYLQLAEEQARSAVALNQKVEKELQTARNAVRSDVRPLKPRELTIIRRSSGVDEKFLLHHSSFQPPAGWPKGEMTFWMQQSAQAGSQVIPVQVQGEGLELRRQGLPTDVAAEIDSRLQLAKLFGNMQFSGTTAPPAELWTLFRGHTWPVKVPINQGTMHPLTLARGALPPPTIVVRGASGERTNLILIFDCSGSMGTRDVPGEIPGTLRLRFDVAKEALKTILPRLDPQQFRIGFMAYGHRVGVRSDNTVEREPETPADIQPANDVETLVALGSPDPQGRIATRLDSLKARGITPLYLSMLRALQIVEKERVPSQIVVLTDGFNFQDRPVELTTESDVTNKLNSVRQARITIVGLKLSPRNDLERRAKPVFDKWLADEGKKQRVQFFAAEDLGSLRDRLLQATNVPEYQVLEGEKELGDANPLLHKWAANPADWKPVQPEREHVVRLQRRNADGSFVALDTAKVTLQGGEALELEVSGSPPKLQHAKWKGRNDGDLLQEVPHGSLRVGFLRPVLDVNVIRFFVSAENTTRGAFTPRPRRVWVEIRPFSNGARVTNDVLFIFTEPFFEPLQPVPVLRCDVPTDLWPSGAEAAQISVWMKHEAASAHDGEWQLDSLPLEKFIPALPDSGVEIQKVSDTRDGTSRTIVIRERHANSELLDKLRLSLDPSPDRIENSTARELLTVDHVMTLPPDLPEGQRITVRLTRKAAIVGDDSPAEFVVQIPR